MAIFKIYSISMLVISELYLNIIFISPPMCIASWSLLTCPLVTIACIYFCYFIHNFAFTHLGLEPVRLRCIPVAGLDRLFTILSPNRFGNFHFVRCLGCRRTGGSWIATLGWFLSTSNLFVKNSAAFAFKVFIFFEL